MHRRKEKVLTIGLVTYVHHYATPQRLLGSDGADVWRLCSAEEVQKKLAVEQLHAAVCLCDSAVTQSWCVCVSTWTHVNLSPWSIT